MAVEFHIVYLSPNGSTQRVAQALTEGVRAGGSSVSVTDLADAEASKDLLRSIREEETTCLFIGSPVYFNKAVPPVMAFIESLPQSEESWAVPFVTYGKACSGVALWQMATALEERGYGIAGAAKVMAVHSLMWESDQPEGNGHPSEEELKQVRVLAESVCHLLQTGALDSLVTGELDYHPEALATELKSTIGLPWPIWPKTVDIEACTECGSCVDECPVDAITLNPVPEFGGQCIDCFNCIRLCPEEAIISERTLDEIGEMVRNRVRDINEQPPTQVFFGGDGGGRAGSAQDLQIGHFIPERRS